MDKAYKMEKAYKYGHRKMIVWQNLDKIEAFIQNHVLGYIPKDCFKLRDQIDRSCSSCVANFIEGYYSGSIREYIRFLRYSKRSQAELQDWIRRCYHKSLLPKSTHYEFDDLAIRTLYLTNRLLSSLMQKIIKPSQP